MSIENFKNPWTNDWAKGEKNHPDWLGGEKVLGGGVEQTFETPKRISKWHGTPQQVKTLEQTYSKFTKILKYLGKLKTLYPNLIDEMHKCTGQPNSLIENALNYNNGARIFVKEQTYFTAQAPNAADIYISKEALLNFESLEGEELKIAIAIFVVTLIHEEVHRLDYKSNGNISGQWKMKREIRNEIGEKITEYIIDFPENLEEGMQYYKHSIYGHRGADIEVLVFGCPGKLEHIKDATGRKTPWISGSDSGSGALNMHEWGTEKAKIFGYDKSDQMNDFVMRMGGMNKIELVNKIFLNT